MRVLSVGMSMEHGSRAKVTHRARDMLHAPHESIMVGVHRQVHTNRNPQRSELRGIHIQITRSHLVLGGHRASLILCGHSIA
jgi:hypothetical protein